MTNAKSGLDAGLFLDEDDDYVVFESGSNKGMCFVSLGGTPSIEIVVSGNNTPLSVGVVGDVVTVNSATDADGDPTSTSAEIIDAVNEDASASLIFLGRLSPGSDGSGVPGAMTETEAADGKAFTGITLTDSGDHLTFQAAAGSRYWDEGESLSVTDNGSPASGYIVNHLRGSVTFGASKSGHTILATGARRSEYAFRKVFGCFDCELKIGSKDIDTTTGDDNGWTSSLPGAKQWDLSYGIFFYNGDLPISEVTQQYFWKVYSTISSVPFAIGKGVIQSIENLLVNPNDAQKQNGTVKGSGELYLE